MRVADIVGVVRRTEVLTVGVRGVGVVRGVVVHVVVAGQRTHRAVHVPVQRAEIRVQRQVVADIVAQQHDAAARVVVTLGEVGGTTLGGVPDLLLVVGLGVRGDRAGLVLGCRGLGLRHGEVHRGRHVAGRFQATERQVGGTLGQVVVAELGEIVGVDRHLPAGWLGDRQGEVVTGGQLVASLLVGGDDVDPVAHGDAGDRLFAVVEGGVAVGVVEDLAGEGGLVLGRIVGDLDPAFVEAVVGGGGGVRGTGERAGERSGDRPGRACGAGGRGAGQVVGDGGGCGGGGGRGERREDGEGRGGEVPA